MLQDRLRSHVLLLALGDLVLVLAAYLAAFGLRVGVSLPGFEATLPEHRFFEVEHLYGLLLLSHLVLLYGFGLYDERLLGLNRGRLFRLSLAASVLQVLTLVGYRYFTNPQSFPHEGSALYFPRSVYLIYLPLNVVGIVAWRAVLLGWLRRSLGALRVAIVGTGPNAMELIGEIRRRPQTGLEVIGVFEEPSVHGAGPEATYCGVPLLGSRADIVEVARRERVSEIIIAGADAAHDRLLETIARSELTQARVSLIPGFYELLIGKVHRLHVHDIPLVEVLREPTSTASRMVKRVEDLVLSLLLGLGLAPVAAVAAILIRLGDAGPILYRQERVGKDRRNFFLYKFRTMSPDAESDTGPVLSGHGDLRVTPLGHWLRRYRVDEIPQLWNVLRGDMSLVGPRPERPFFVEGFLRQIPGYSERFKVKPGLTGLAQVRGTYESTAQNKLRYDLAYIYNQSLGLDLSILADTVKEVLNSRGH